jgi:hypothetical protein
MVDFHKMLQRSREKKENREMADGRIPVNAADLPVESILMETDKVYQGMLTKVALAGKLDKSGNVWASIEVEVTGGDYEGTKVDKNYIRIPENKYASDLRGEQIRKHNKGVEWGQFCKAFGITGEPIDGYPEDLDAEAFRNFQEWIEPFLGNPSKVGFTVTDNEFGGRKRSVINQFLF